MHIPAFSLFSAISELFVTAGVLFVVRRNWTRRPFPFPLFLGVALFEGLINVMYMAKRASDASAPAAAAAAHALSAGMKIGFAVHGLLSLLAYLVFVVLGVFAHQEQQQQEPRWFFRERPALTWTFLVFWAISIGSGEVLFALRYLR